MRRPIRILGIDPGLRRTGWGVVTIEGNRLGFVACGSLASDERTDLAIRLLAIHDGLRRVVAEHAPDEAAVEATFVNKDASATLKLGQARGIAMLVPAIAGLRVAEYAPNLVKKTIDRRIAAERGSGLRRCRRRARDRGVPCASSPERGAQGERALIALDCPGKARVSAVAVAAGFG